MKTIRTFKVIYEDWLAANYGKKHNSTRHHQASAEFTKLINYLIHIGAVK